MADSSDSKSSTSEAVSDKPEEAAREQPQAPTYSGFPLPAQGDKMMLPVLYPALVPGFHGMQNQEQMNRRPGIYAVPVLPVMGQVAQIPSNMFIPFTYSTPTRSSTTETGVAGGEQNQVSQQQQQMQHAPQIGPQRQIVVRRFQIAFQLDLLLIMKLAFVIFLFNQDGSRQRLALLVFLASLVYLYQTGALTPIVRWLSQAMHRAAAPPRPQRPAARADPAVRLGNENVPADRADPAVRLGNENVPAAAAEGQPGEESNRQLADDANLPAENEAGPEPGADGGNQWWGIVKEIQMIVFGFITSLLPGFHNIDHHEA